MILIRFLVLFVLMSVIGGCANTAKTDSPEIRIVQITLKFRGPIDVNAFQYYIALSGQTRPLVPEIPPSKYFPTPGRTYNDAHPDFQNQTDAILPFYTSFFNTWSDYIVVGRRGISLFKSNSTGFTATSADDHFNYLENILFSGTYTTSGSTMIIRFQMLELSAASATQLYYSIFTSEVTDSPVTEAGTLRDILQDAQAAELVIDVEKNAQIGPFFDSEDTSATASDLVEWSIDIL
jgi:hypothetical protein